MRAFQGGDGVDVRGPRDIGSGDARVLDDAQFAYGGRVIQWDLKTKDTWCATHLGAGTTLRELDEQENVAMHNRYSEATGPVRVDVHPGRPGG